MAATGGAPPYSWAANSHAPGLAFSSTGVWSGTPTTAGAYSFIIQVADSAGVTVTATFQLTINPVPPSITTIAAAGGSGKYRLFAGPDGGRRLTALHELDRHCRHTAAGFGALFGHVEGHAADSGIVQFHRSSHGQCRSQCIGRIPVDHQPLAAGDYDRIPFACRPREYPLLAIPDSHRRDAPLQLDSVNCCAGPGLESSRRMDRHAHCRGTYNVAVKVTDSVGGIASKSFQVTINAPPLAITTASPLPAGQINSGYSQTLAASGGAPPLTWTTTTGTVPSGMTLSAAGVLSGTPTASGTYNFTVRAMDSTGASASAPFQLTINTSQVTISTTSPLPAGQVNAGYSQALVAGGGNPPYTKWTIYSGALPPGLTLASALFEWYSHGGGIVHVHRAGDGQRRRVGIGIVPVND